jgi:hypothetical protein
MNCTEPEASNSVSQRPSRVRRGHLAFGMRASRVLAVGATVAILAGCGSKPPGCADAETIANAKRILIEHGQKFQARINHVPDDPDGWSQKYYEGLKIDISGIVSEGYKADAKKQMCKGTVKFATINDQVFEQSVEYTTQRTEDDKTGFLIELMAVDETLIKIGTYAQNYLEANRWSGDWNGTYACSGYRGATEGPQGPYRVPVILVVKGKEGMIERTTLGGGIEAIGMEFRPGAPSVGTIVYAEGKGRNTPDDVWFTKFEGKVQGKQLMAEGAISVPGFGSVRQCRLELALGAPMAAPAATPATSLGSLPTAIPGTYDSPTEGVKATIEPARPDGKYPVALSVTVQRPGGGGCGGDAKGLATPAGNTLSFLAEDRGDRCQATLAFSDGKLVVGNTEGCDAFVAGSGACTFEATLAKSR